LDDGKREKKGTNQEESSVKEDSSKIDFYEANVRFSDEDNEGFVFIQDVTCNLNGKARIPDNR